MPTPPLLKPYIVYPRHACPSEGACLIFAKTCRQAIRIGFPAIKNFDDELKFIEVTAKLMRGGLDHLYVQANQELLSKGIAHEIDDPESCISCLQWGRILTNKICKSCLEEDF